MVHYVAAILGIILTIFGIAKVLSGENDNPSPPTIGITITEPKSVTITPDSDKKKIIELEERLARLEPLNTIGETVRRTANETAIYYADKKDNSINFNHEVIEDNDSVSANFYFDKKIFFQETHYNTQHAIEKEKFIEALITFTKSLGKVCKGNARPSSVTFEGSSDTSGKKESTLGDRPIQIYQGEYGEIDVNAKINGQNKRVHFKKDDLLNNSELAFMRGYGVSYLFRDELKKRGVVIPENIIDFIGQEVNGHGEENRYGRITFKIDSPKKQCISSSKK